MFRLVPLLNLPQTLDREVAYTFVNNFMMRSAHKNEIREPLPFIFRLLGTISGPARAGRLYVAHFTNYDVA